jgi:hypothetical protein
LRSSCIRMWARHIGLLHHGDLYVKRDIPNARAVCVCATRKRLEKVWALHEKRVRQTGLYILFGSHKHKWRISELTISHPDTDLDIIQTSHFVLSPVSRCH